MSTANDPRGWLRRALDELAIDGVSGWLPMALPVLAIAGFYLWAHLQVTPTDLYLKQVRADIAGMAGADHLDDDTLREFGRGVCVHYDNNSWQGGPIDMVTFVEDVTRHPWWDSNPDGNDILLAIGEAATDQLGPEHNWTHQVAP